MISEMPKQEMYEKKILRRDRPPKGMPVLLAEDFESDRGTPLWKVWCPYCRASHVHARAEGHVWAHCVDRPDGPYYTSPFHETGYWLRWAGRER